MTASVAKEAITWCLCSRRIASSEMRRGLTGRGGGEEGGGEEGGGSTWQQRGQDHQGSYTQPSVTDWGRGGGAPRITIPGATD